MGAIDSAAPLTSAEEIDGDELESGWVRVTGKGNVPPCFRLSNFPRIENLWEQELEMEEFYVSKKDLAKRLSRERIFASSRGRL